MTGRVEAVVERGKLGERPGVLHVVGARRHQRRQVQQRARHVRFQRLAPGRVAPDVTRPGPFGRQRAAVEAGPRLHALGRTAARWQPAARLRIDVVRGNERQRQELRPAGRHLLVERRQPRRRGGIARHEPDEVDGVAFTDEAHQAAVGVRAQVVLAEDLAPGLDDDGLVLVEPGHRLPVPHDVDDRRVETHRHRFHLVQRPLEGLVVLARRREDGQLEQGPAERDVPAQVRAARPEPADRGRGARRSLGRVGHGSGQPVAGVRPGVGRERAGQPPERQLLHARARGRQVEVALRIGCDVVAGAQDALRAERSENLERRAFDDHDAVAAADVQELLRRVRRQGQIARKGARRA